MCPRELNRLVKSDNGHAFIISEIFFAQDRAIIFDSKQNESVLFTLYFLLFTRIVLFTVYLLLFNLIYLHSTFYIAISSILRLFRHIFSKKLSSIFLKKRLTLYTQVLFLQIFFLDKYII
jgi:hypothetical protein